MVCSLFLVFSTKCDKIKQKITKLSGNFFSDVLLTDYPVYNPPIKMPSSYPSNTQMDASNFSTPITNHPTAKRRKSPKDVPDIPSTAKRLCSHLPTNQLPIKGLKKKILY